MKTKINHLTKILGLLVVVALLTCWWFVGGSHHSPIFRDLATGKSIGVLAPKLYYRGFQIPFTDFAFCKRYYAITDYDEHVKNVTLITVNQAGDYNPFVIYYEDGTLAARGECMIEDFGEGNILHDISNSKDAEFFDTNGKLVSKVTNGTGIVKLYFPNGQQYWESKQKNYVRVQVKMWKPDGTLSTDQQESEADDVLQINK